MVVTAIIVIGIVLLGRLAPFGPVQSVFGVFTWLTEQGIDLAQTLFERYGYLTVFFAPMLENTLFVGAIIPGTLIMLLAGLSIHDGLIAPFPAVPLAIAGAMIGDTISYGIGRFGWRRLGPESRLAKWSERMRDPLLKHSVWLILTYHFAGYSRLVGPAAAGFLRMPLLRWMVLDYIGVAIWVVTFLGAGYLLGVLGLSLEESDRNIQVFEIILFAIFIIAILTVLRATRQRRRRLSETASPDGHHPEEEVPAAVDEGAKERVR